MYRIYMFCCLSLFFCLRIGNAGNVIVADDYSYSVIANGETILIYAISDAVSMAGDGDTILLYGNVHGFTIKGKSLVLKGYPFLNSSSRDILSTLILDSSKVTMINLRVFGPAGQSAVIGCGCSSNYPGLNCPSPSFLSGSNTPGGNAIRLIATKLNMTACEVRGGGGGTVRKGQWCYRLSTTSVSCQDCPDVSPIPSAAPGGDAITEDGASTLIVDASSAVTGGQGNPSGKSISLLDANSTYQVRIREVSTVLKGFHQSLREISTTAQRMHFACFIPSKSVVRLDAFNMDGKNISVLYEGIHESGEFRAEWDTSKVPAGVYVCRLLTNSGVTARRVVLLR